ncbi:MAG: tRNA preQ1(34) S-adenosylmethionine ribosyltransferase-isomerase QueA [Candidatus Omnitrophica bacterium]|jgi:S-adenosylmethionine:tRNA ribosyltransferase-isomerase|nr:tRNA preQ1(34) S-adenosylmethionine ribosyltransferase-isomerase QueA [Candidatus Omnitrophota bacterium]
MHLKDFDYYLPKELIAQFPLKQRDRARLIVVDRADGTIQHRIFSDIVEYINKDDLLVLNDTKVVSCRLMGTRITGGKVEVFLLEHLGAGEFKAMISPARGKDGDVISFHNGALTARITGHGRLSFSLANPSEIYRFGLIPLPPYIKREPEKFDWDYYQTIYAKEEGAIASPTAGLHFTKQLIHALELKGAQIGYLTLHVGQATFKSVTVDNITEHKMDYESFNISDNTVKLIQETRSQGKKIFAVGTTSLRTLETFAKTKSQEGKTNLFIYPGYKFKLTDCLLTNFHLPRTTLFMLVCAFAGTELAKKAYKEAIEQKYRFYSYGDAMLII